MADNRLAAYRTKPATEDKNRLAAYRTPSLSAGDVAKGAAKNFPASAAQFVKDIITPFLHPVETGKSLADLATGAVQAGTDLEELGGDAPQADMARAVAKFFVDRYGGAENLKRTMANDPVGSGADISILATGGATAGARLPGIAGKAARLVGEAGKVVDPVQGAVKAVKGAGKLVGKGAAALLGTTTGVGSTAITTAAASGRAGGNLGAKFRAAMRGEAPFDEVVEEARGAVKNLYDRRAAQYQNGFAAIKGDPTILDFDKVDEALESVLQVKQFKGRSISKSTEAIKLQVADAIAEWRALKPSEFHTVEGFDALKQSIGDILSTTQKGTPEWRVVNEVYQGISKEITRQAPGYAKIMKNYTQATDTLKELPNCPFDTSV